MQTVTSGVTHGVDPVLVVGEWGSVVEELVEDRVDGLGVRLRADTAVVVARRREGHMARVVCAVKVDAIPAGREVGLSSQSITGLSGETVVVGCGPTGQANVLNSLLGKA